MTRIFTDSHTGILGLSLLFLAVIASGCRQPPQTAQPAPGDEGGAEMTIQLTSSAFTEGGNIPRRHTCDSEDLSPPLSWSGIPAGTVSLALIVDDLTMLAGSGCTGCWSTCRQI